MSSNREYKSDVFSMLMEVPEYALEIYNVLNGSHYTNPALIHILKLEKGVLLTIRNDASFVLDAYEHREKLYELELKCIAYNINSGYNQDIQNNSRVLSGYTVFVEKVRSYAKEEMTLKAAVELAVEECIREDILAEFFREHRREVVHVAALDFTFERREKLIRRDSLEEGIEIGVSQGIKQGEILKLVSLVCRKLQKGKNASVIAEELEEEQTLVDQICEVAKSFAPNYDEQAICKALKQ